MVSPDTSEMSTAVLTESCLNKFQGCLKHLQGEDMIHAQTKLADFRLWADSVGATASEKASLDWRLQNRPEDVHIIRGLLSMLEVFLEDFLITAANESNIQDIITNIDTTVDSLAFMGVHIRRSGYKSRLRRTDASFDQNRYRYRRFRAYLACLIASKPIENGRSKDMVHSVDYFAKLKLSPIQERLVEANLRRLHRFMEAQRHSHRLEGSSSDASRTIIPQEYVVKAAQKDSERAIAYPDNGANLIQNKMVAAVVQSSGLRKHNHTATTTSASGLDSNWGGLQYKRRPGSTVTRITAITATARYPKVHNPSNPSQTLVKCPCCCQAIPTAELEDSQWRKHVANDLCPYTCVVEKCPTPYKLFVSQKAWNNHVMKDHPPQWQCLICLDDSSLYKSLSAIISHTISVHPDDFPDELEDFLSDAEMNVMGITTCPLCDSEGPQDSPDLVEHVLQHIHDFSLRSLPWPMDPILSLDKPVGTFDPDYLAKSVQDDEGNIDRFDIGEWAESVVPSFDLGRGSMIVNDPEGEEVILQIDGWPDDTTQRGEPSLQLCDIDLNPPMANEEASTHFAQSERDYFSRNDYFRGGSSDGRFSSQISTMSQDTRDTIREFDHDAEQTQLDVDEDAQDRQYGNALQAASFKGQDDSVQMLLERGADVDAQGGQYGNALQAASVGGHHEIVQILLDYGANVNAHGGLYGNALSAASSKGHDKIVKTLINRGVDLDIHGGQYGSALQAASFKGHYETVQILLENGADPDASGGQFGNSLQAALAGGHDKTVQLLLNNGVDVNCQGGTYGTALQAASAGGHQNMVEMLLAYGADVNAQGGHYGTALYAAQAGGYEGIMQMLLESGAEVSTRGRQPNDSLKLLEHVVAIRKRVLPEDHPDRLASQYDLARAYLASEQVLEAIRLLEYLEAIYGRVLAEDHPDRLASQYELARAYLANGQVKGAIQLLEHVVAIEERVLGEDHPTRLASQHQLAGAYQANGQVQEAVQLLEHVVAIVERALGEDHPTRLASQHQLAGAYQASGQVQEAVQLLEHVVAIREQVLQEDHPDRLASQRELASAYVASDRIKKASEP